MYATHPLMVIDTYAKYGKPMSNKKIVKARTQKHVQNPVNFNLEVKGQRRIGIMNVRDTSFHCDIHTCAKMVS